MSRVRSVIQILIAITLLAACAPAAPTPTAVPATVTAAPTNTVTLTATLTPTLTLTPTETPTPVPTQEDFSDIEHASSIDEALEKKPVSLEDVKSGRLIRLAESMAEPWPEGVESPSFTLKEISPGYVVINTESISEGIQDMGTYRVDEGNGYDGGMVKVIRVLQSNGQDGYIILSIDMKAFGNDSRTLSAVKRQPYLLPFYEMKNQESSVNLISKLVNDQGANPGLKGPWYLYYYDKVQPMVDEWLETGIIPKDLSLIPLPSTTSASY